MMALEMTTGRLTLGELKGDSHAEVRLEEGQSQ